MKKIEIPCLFERCAYMKRYRMIAVLLLLFTLASCGLKESDASREEKIRALVKASLDIQYGYQTDDLALVYTEEFYNHFPDYYDKDTMGPYKVYNYDYMTTLTETDEGELVVAVRVADQQGSYIQVIHMVKHKADYLISNIEYDI